MVVDAADAARSRLVQNLKCSQITIRLVTTGPVTSFPISNLTVSLVSNEAIDTNDTKETNKITN